MKKETTDSSLRNESLKWWANCQTKTHFMYKHGFYSNAIQLSDEEIEQIYLAETNPKAIIGSGVEENWEEEAEIRYPVKNHVSAPNSPYKHSNTTFKHGCRYGYSEAQKTIQSLRDSNAELLKALHTILSNFKANQNFGTLPNKQELESGINIMESAINKAKSIN